MRKNSVFNVLTLGGALLGATLGAGCVQSRPARNGVFNENQFVRKDFLIRPGDASKGDTGWITRATITAVSTPNPFGADFFLTPGLESGASLVRFDVTEDTLNMLNMRELTNVPTDERTPEVVNSWGITNVDLKYRVNLDGENTNFYEENQENDWQVRQWVKLKFAKNNMSDLYAFGPFASQVLAACVDQANAAATLVPGSFRVEEQNDYMQFKVRLELPVRWDDATCVQAYGPLGVTSSNFGRQNVTVDVMYSFMRAKDLSGSTYKPLEVAEKDPIRRKYGWFDTIVMNRDESSGQLAARQLVSRFDPTKPITWYFSKDFPQQYKAVFLAPNGIKDQTNKLLSDAGVAARLDFKEFDADLPQPAMGQVQHPREYGDVRYNMLTWMTDRDTQEGFAGLTEFTTDPRTGETLSASIILNDFAIKDYYVQRIDAYLQTVGASQGINQKYCKQSMGTCNVDADCDSVMKGDTCSDAWPDPGACNDGDVLPIVQATVINNHNGNSSLYSKMQQYLQKPVGTYGPLGPQDFVAKQDDDFYRAYYALLPYYVFGDPDANPFVIREGGAGVYGPTNYWKKLGDEAKFQQLAASIDRGESPFEENPSNNPNHLADALSFLNNFRSLTTAHREYGFAKMFANKGLRTHLDTPDAFSFEQIIQRDARHCIGGHWETKQEWTDNLIFTYWAQVIWHEFGHSMGLSHNFMASLDKNNFPTYMDAQGNQHYGLYSNSVMEYNAAPDRVFWGNPSQGLSSVKDPNHPTTQGGGWAPYDQGAISWIYANNTRKSCKADADCGTGTCGATGTCSSAAGLSGQVDGATPWRDPKGFSSDGKTETQYLFCRDEQIKYSPFCRQGDMGTTPSEIIANAIDAYEWQYHWRNFRSYRKYWDNSQYASSPAGMIVDMRRFLSLWAFDWSAGELADALRRLGIQPPPDAPSAVQYYTQLTNKFNKEASTANQMVGAFHKAIIQQSSGERPFKTIYDKYYGDTTQQGIILDKLFAMQGWVALWPTDNYDQNQAGGYISSWSGEVGDASYDTVAEDAITSMIGGQYDVYPYFVPLAVAQFAQDTHQPEFLGGRTEARDWIGGWQFYREQDFLDFFRSKAVEQNMCSDLASCTYDPRPLSDQHNEFVAPDKRVYIWAKIVDRNQWVVAQKDRHIASYVIIRNYTDDVIFQLDDGAYPGGAYGAELPLKYYLDSFAAFN